ncbi:MAG: Glu/Leu/Phe/Val dehydrogenase dimerization domain-containing protein [Planctomycetota bacterium]
MRSIFDPLLAGGWTGLVLRHDRGTGAVAAFATREWDSDRAFAAYGREFDHETVLTPRCARLDAAATRALYGAAGSTDKLDLAAELLRAGGHEGIDLWIHAGRDIRFLNNVHSTRLGIGNGRHALRGGGIRRHDRADGEEEVLVDGLNLARGMSFKNAAAGLPYGGAKLCVHAAPIALDDFEALGFVAWCIDRSRAFTGPDMGFLPQHADVLRRDFTRNIVGGPGGALGPTGTPTARGVFLALREAVRQHMGREEPAGLAVAVQGLGAVGAPLARELLAAGVGRLLAADPSPERRDAFLAGLSGADRARTALLPPAEVLFAAVDIVCPCAIGGILGAEEIDRLRCRIVMGAANNQLRAVSQAAELVLADRLAARGILYQIDWMHNGAGVLAGMEEYERQEEARMENVLARLERVCGEGVRRNLADAAARGVTPTALAYERLAARIYGPPGGGFR